MRQARSCITEDDSEKLLTLGKALQSVSHPRNRSLQIGELTCA